MEYVKDKIYFIALGGADEIGINMYAYGLNGKWIVVDAGYGFLHDDYPGMDMCYASPAFLENFKGNIEGLFITHAHEDHMGAVAHVWPSLECPVYATPFAAGLIKERLEEYKMADIVPVEIVHSGDVIKTSVFDVKFISLTHSVPQTCGLLIESISGRIFHATDWRFDDGKLSSLQKTDYKALKDAAAKGIDLFVCDSTNIFVDKKGPSEADIRQNLKDLICSLKGGIVATCFASNLMRIESLILAAVAAQRTPVVIGRSIQTNIKIAKECGYFSDLPKIYMPEETEGLSPDNALYICTGSQANYRSAMSIIAKGESKYIKLDENYTAIFSSKIIPGNEDKIEHLQEEIMTLGAKVITEITDEVHTSGHASKQELRAMYKLLKPKIVFPVHGEKRFIREHVRFALSCGVPEVASCKNGDLLCLADGHIIKTDEITTEIMGVDRGRCISLHSEVIKNRRRIANNGSLFISVFVAKDNKILDLEVTSLDILLEDDWNALVLQIKKENLAQIQKELYESGVNEKTKEVIKARIRKAVLKATNMKPVTVLHIFQQGED